MKSKKRFWSRINKITFFFLSFFLLILFSSMFFSINHVWLLLVFFGLIILILGLVEEKKKLKHERYTLARGLEVLISLPIAAMLTFFISADINLGPVIAASFVGLLGSLFSHRLANPIYCGTFVGMSSLIVFPSPLLVGISGLIAGFVFVLSHEIYNQTGGTLGTIAFSAVTIVKRIGGLL